MEPSDLVRLFLFERLLFFKLESVNLENDVAPKRYYFFKTAQPGEQTCNLLVFIYFLSTAVSLAGCCAPIKKIISFTRTIRNFFIVLCFLKFEKLCTQDTCIVGKIKVETNLKKNCPFFLRMPQITHQKNNKKL